MSASLRQSGFTAIEILLVVAVLSILVTATLPIAQRMQTAADLDAATSTLVQGIRRAQLLSQAMEQDSQWGVTFTQGAITLFRGNSFSGRDPLFDEVTAVSEAVVFSGLSEIIFTKLNGDVQQTGSITLTGPNNETRTLTINAKGTLEY